MPYMSAVFGLVTLFLMLLFFSILLSKMTKLRISFSSAFTAFFFTIPTTAYLTGLFLPQKNLTGLALTETDKWIGGLFIFAIVVIYVVWLFIFQPHSVETLLRKKVKDEALAECSQSIRVAKMEMTRYEKNSEEYNAKLNFIKQLKLRKKQIKSTYRLGSWYGSLVWRLKGGKG